MNKDAKNIHINIRLTQADMEQVRTICKAQDISQSHCMRCCIKHCLGNDEDKIFERDAQFKKSMLNQACRIRNNINQIAYRLNYLKKSELHNRIPEIVEQSQSKLSEITSTLQEIKNILNEWKALMAGLKPISGYGTLVGNHTGDYIEGHGRYFSKYHGQRCQKVTYINIAHDSPSVPNWAERMDDDRRIMGCDIHTSIKTYYALVNFI